MSKVGVNHNLCKYVLDKKFRHVPYSDILIPIKIIVFFNFFIFLILWGLN